MSEGRLAEQMERPNQIIYKVQYHVLPSGCFPHNKKEREEFVNPACNLCADEIDIDDIVKFKIENNYVILCFDCAKDHLYHKCRDCENIIKWDFPMGESCTRCFVKRFVR